MEKTIIDGCECFCEVVKQSEQIPWEATPKNLVIVGLLVLIVLLVLLGLIIGFGKLSREPIDDDDDEFNYY